MPRFARIVYPSGIYHVICRFYNREFLVTDEEERSYYLGLLASGLAKSDAILLAWCIMSNHVHLLNNPALGEAEPQHVIAKMLINLHQYICHPDSPN